jgi:hypothetical protein
LEESEGQSTLSQEEITRSLPGGEMLLDVVEAGEGRHVVGLESLKSSRFVCAQQREKKKKE